MPIMAMSLWLTQNNCLSYTKQSKAVYIAAAKVLMSAQTHLS